MKLQDLFEQQDIAELERELKQARKRLAGAEEYDRSPGQGTSSSQRLRDARNEVQRLEAKVERAKDPRSDDEIRKDEDKGHDKKTIEDLKRLRAKADEKIKTLPEYGADQVKRALPKIDQAIKDLEAGKSRRDIDFSKFTNALSLIRGY
jgi:hypothetical protein